METRAYPSKADICAAMQGALTAALGAPEPWGNGWATGVLGGLLWRAREAEEGSAELGELLSEAGSHARIALHGTAGYVHVYTLETLNTQWFMAEPEGPPCDCSGCVRARQRRTAASVGAVA